MAYGVVVGYCCRSCRHVAIMRCRGVVSSELVGRREQVSGAYQQSGRSASTVSAAGVSAEARIDNYVAVDVALSFVLSS